MNYQKRILLIDNKPDEHKVLEGLTASGWSVRSSYSGREGITAARDWRPDVTLVDYMMPEMDGLTVCQELKHDPVTKDLPVILFTKIRETVHFKTGLSTADDFIEKSLDFEKLLAKVSSWSRHFIPYPDVEGHRELALTCQPNHPLSYRAGQRPSVSNHLRGPVQIAHDFHSAIATMVQYRSKALHGNMQAADDDWRPIVKSEGWDIYSKTFLAFPEFLAEYRGVRMSVKKDRNLHLHLESPRALLAFPFEFLFDADPAEGAGEFLVNRHPFTRVVTNGEHSAREGISRNWLNNIRKAQNDGRPEEGTLRVLLVASNTEPAIPGVDHEVDLLAAQIPAFFAMVGINVEVTKIPTEEATGERVCEAIRDSKFHVLHYAGHASFDATRTEKSSLYFWSKGNRQGVPEALGTHVLSDVLENSEIRLVYFSCCSSAGSGSADDAKKFSFLGMADAAISGKVPGIVGFRWPVTDSGAMALSREFYRTLAKDGELDSALMRARIALRQQLPDDPSWLSPILTVQL